MKEMMKKTLTNKAARNSQSLKTVMNASVAAFQPWA